MTSEANTHTIDVVLSFLFYFNSGATELMGFSFYEKENSPTTSFITSRQKNIENGIFSALSRVAVNLTAYSPSRGWKQNSSTAKASQMRMKLPPTGTCTRVWSVNHSLHALKNIKKKLSKSLQDIKPSKPHRKSPFTSGNKSFICHSLA